MKTDEPRPGPENMLQREVVKLLQEAARVRRQFPKDLWQVDWKRKQVMRVK